MRGRRIKRLGVKMEDRTSRGLRGERWGGESDFIEYSLVTQLLAVRRLRVERN